LYGIKNVGEGAVDHILLERERGGDFQDLFDFCSRIDSAVVNKRAVEFLLKAGAFDRLSPSAGGDELAGRAALLATLDTAIKFGNAKREQRAQGQSSLFGDSASAAPDLEDPGEVDELELLRFEKEALGIYISAHPMASYP